jgi:dephospho-CoA kinase
MATHLRATYGNGYMAEQVYDRAQASWQNVVIESLMAVGEVEAMRSKWWTFYLFAVDADIAIRYKRIVSRGWEKDNVSFEEFEHHEKIEMDNEDPNKQNIAKCMKLADYTFTNNWNLEELQKQVEDAIIKLQF